MIFVTSSFVTIKAVLFYQILHTEIAEFTESEYPLNHFRKQTLHLYTNLK